eukprot:GFUD01021063.1.p1 GENE.GFUD01021063.1~~GFUD01021063.1.p1  ORF type:complete len:229 (+),score=73.58 GFUD01021063.1:113-799(+)
MAWTWTGFKYDPVFRFKDKDFFQPGLNQAEARFWKLKIHKEVDRRGTQSSIKFIDVDEDLGSHSNIYEKDCKIPELSKTLQEEYDDWEEETEGETSSPEIHHKPAQSVEHPRRMIPDEHEQYQNNTETQYRAVSPAGSTSSYCTPVQYSTSQAVQYSAGKQYKHTANMRNTSVSSMDSGMGSMRSGSRGSSGGRSMGYQSGDGEDWVDQELESAGVRKDKEHLSSKFY